MSTRSSLHVSTTATRAQLPAVRVLAASLRTHHAEAELSVLLLDGDEAVAEAGRGVERCTLLAPDAVDVPADLFAKLAMACTVDELAAVLAPRLVHLLVGQSVPAVIALSPETEVVGPLDDVIALAAEHGIVLVPRVDAPLPDDGLEPDESQLREAGPFASELVAVGANGASFTEWWGERQLEAALRPGGLKAAGPWTAEIAAMFRCRVLRDPGYVVSAWNLHSRDLEITDEGYVVSGRPLRTVNFRGYSRDEPQLLSGEFERPRVRLSDHPALAQLCDEHSVRSAPSPGEAELRTAYRYDTLPDGREIDGRMRRMYVDALHDTTTRGDPEPPSPFGVHGVDAFVAWVTEPVAPPVDPQVSRYLTRVRDENEILRHVYPALGGEGAEQYLGWACTCGRDDQEIPSWVLPSEDDVIALTKRRWRRARPAGGDAASISSGT